MRNLLLAALSYYFYNEMKKKYEAAMNDRAALLNMLTPDQKDLLVRGINKTADIYKSVTQ